MYRRFSTGVGKLMKDDENSKKQVDQVSTHGRAIGHEHAPGALAKCLACGCGDIRGHFPGLCQCAGCGFVSADVTMSDTEVEALYGRDYFHGGEYFDYLAEEEGLRINFRSRLKVLRSIVPNMESKNLLEVGCAYGFFLDEVGPHVRSAVGIDVAASAVEHGTATLGIDARVGNFLEMVPDREYGIVTMWDTIEHLKRPDLFVEKASQILGSGGILALTTGDIGSVNARLRGRTWRMIHPPTHMHYFSVPTVRKMLEQFGFEVIHVSHPGNWRKLRAILYGIAVLRFGYRGLYEFVSPLPFWNMCLPINLFDIMYVIARRV